MNFNVSELLIISPLVWLFLASIIPMTMKAFSDGKEMSPINSLFWGGRPDIVGSEEFLEYFRTEFCRSFF